MPSEPKQKNPALNLYNLMDNEMARMHELLKHTLSFPQNMHTSSSLSQCGFIGTSNDIYQRIVNMQTTMIDAIRVHDPAIQEKVAELALMGTANDPG